MIALILAKLASASALGTPPRPALRGGAVGSSNAAGTRSPGGSRNKDLAIDMGQWLLERQFVSDGGAADQPGDMISLAHAIDAVTAALVIQLGVNKLRTGRISPTGWRGYADALAHALSSGPPTPRTPSPVALALSYVITARVSAPRVVRGEHVPPRPPLGP